MRRFVPLGVIAAVMVVSIVWIQNATKNRVDEATPGTWTEVEFDVSLPGGATPDISAAQRLWGVCQGNLSPEVTDGDLVEVEAGIFGVRLEPALGSNGWRRLKGCLNDATLDRMQGRVVDVVQSGGEDLAV